MGVMHFSTQKERIDFLKGNFEEIIPQIAEEKPEKVEEVAEKEEKSPKKRKKGKKNDKIQAE